MINKIIQELEAKIAYHKDCSDKCQSECDIDGMSYHVDRFTTFNEAIDIIKKHEAKFREAIEDAYNQGESDGRYECGFDSAQDYYNQKYKSKTTTQP
jgi:hypothetical protein